MASVETVCGSTEFVCCFQESLGNYEDVTKVFLIQQLGGPNCLHRILTRHPLKWTKMDILHTTYILFVQAFWKWGGRGAGGGHMPALPPIFWPALADCPKIFGPNVITPQPPSP